MDFDHLDQLRDLSRQPLQPATPQRSAWGAVVRGAAAGAAEFFSDFTGLNPQPDPVSRRTPSPVDEMVKQSDAKNAEMARRSREYARELRPDPATAGLAENIVFGLSRGLTKAAGAVATAGPVAGAVAFGGSEAAAINDDLERVGVDPQTRGKVAALTGVANAASILLPMSGPTLKSTAALYLAGGPGGFIAQQAGTRQILESAGYAQEASKYDPLDPVGLTLSALVPLPFAAGGAWRNIKANRAARAVEPPRVDGEPMPAVDPRDATDAAMVHNLTALRDAQEAAVKSGEMPVKLEPVPDAPAVPAAAIPEPVRPVVMEPQAARPDLGRFSDAYESARALLDESRTTGKPLEQIVTDRTVTPEVNNLALGLREAGDDVRRVTALVERLSREARDHSKTAGDATADAVQGMMALTEQQLRDLAPPAKASTPTLMEQTASRVDQLRAQAPDTPVRVAEDGKLVNVADELDRAKREASEGLDDELGALDAYLLRVAAECALSLGAI